MGLFRKKVDPAVQTKHQQAQDQLEVKAAFDEAGIEIPFPKRDITIINPDQNPTA